MAAPGYQLSPPAYYRELGEDLERLILNLDSPSDFKFGETSLRDIKTRNFVLDFSDDEAWCGFNLEAEQLGKLLRTSRPSSLNTRWINIWRPQEQKEVLEALAKHYDFSPRLLGLMSSPPLCTLKRPHTPESRASSSKSLLAQLLSLGSTANRRSQKYDSALDSEDSIGLTPIEASYKLKGGLEINQYVLANELYYYTSMDWGRRYICLGYNTLHDVSTDSNTFNVDPQPSPIDKPGGKRVWNWLLLCDAKTIITIQEDVFATCSLPLTYRDRRALETVRRNTITIFAQCSKASLISTTMLLPIRHRLGTSDEETLHRATDVPGLLFFYLFADELTTYSLIARREHKYAVELNNLRLAMMERAELAHIERLHAIGRHLSVLRRMYVSYEGLIDRLLEPRAPTLASLKNSVVASGEQSLDASRRDFDGPEEQAIGVSLSSAARVRFERLKGSIRLYAVCEIEECEKVKEGLVMMNFNLLAIKESRSVERLTRVTLLLAKLTFLFMPISVVTAYFSCQFVDTEFTVRSYWAWFAGTASASLVLLLAFSALSGTMEADIAYKSISGKAVECVSRLVGRTRRRRD